MKRLSGICWGLALSGLLITNGCKLSEIFESNRSNSLSQGRGSAPDGRPHFISRSSVLSADEKVMFLDLCDRERRLCVVPSLLLSPLAIADAAVETLGVKELAIVSSKGSRLQERWPAKVKVESFGPLTKEPADGVSPVFGLAFDLVRFGGQPPEFLILDQQHVIASNGPLWTEGHPINSEVLLIDSPALAQSLLAAINSQAEVTEDFFGSRSGAPGRSWAFTYLERVHRRHGSPERYENRNHPLGDQRWNWLADQPLSTHEGKKGAQRCLDAGSVARRFFSLEARWKDDFSEVALAIPSEVFSCLSAKGKDFLCEYHNGARSVGPSDLAALGGKGSESKAHCHRDGAIPLVDEEESTAMVHGTTIYPALRDLLENKLARTSTTANKPVTCLSRSETLPRSFKFQGRSFGHKAMGCLLSVNADSHRSDMFASRLQMPKDCDRIAEFCVDWQRIDPRRILTPLLTQTPEQQPYNGGNLMIIEDEPQSTLVVSSSEPSSNTLAPTFLTAMAVTPQQQEFWTRWLTQIASSQGRRQTPPKRPHLRRVWLASPVVDELISIRVESEDSTHLARFHSHGKIAVASFEVSSQGVANFEVAGFGDDRQVVRCRFSRPNHLVKRMGEWIEADKFVDLTQCQ